MTLADVLADLDAQPAEGTILAEPPWSLASRAFVREVETDSAEKMTEDGQTYLIEVELALEARDDLRAMGWHGERLLQAIIHYVLHDAYPDPAAAPRRHQIHNSRA